MTEQNAGLKPTLWVVIVIASSTIAFLLGYSVSAFTGVQTQQGNIGLETGGYGEESEGGGYGAVESTTGSGDELDEAAKEYYENLIGDESESGQSSEEGKELLY